MWRHLLQGTIQPTHYRLCQCKDGSEACELFQRERGQRECRRRACVELEAKTESRLPDESKDPVSPTSLCRMRHPHTHVLRRRRRRRRGGSCSTVFLLHSRGLSGISHCSGRQVSRHLEATWAWLGVGRQHYQGRRAGARREQRYNVPELLWAPWQALKAMLKTCRDCTAFGTEAVVHKIDCMSSCSHRDLSSQTTPTSPASRRKRWSYLQDTYARFGIQVSVQISSGKRPPWLFCTGLLRQGLRQWWSLGNGSVTLSLEQKRTAGLRKGLWPE